MCQALLLPLIFKVDLFFAERRNLVGGQTSVTLTDSAASQRADKRKTVNNRLREPAFACALKMHERERWVFHPSIRDSVDAFYLGDPVAAVLLEPGKQIAICAIPEMDRFVYCLECGRLEKTACAKHARATPEAFSAFSRGGAQQFSGVCFCCGAPGHRAMDCPAGRR